MDMLEGKDAPKEFPPQEYSPICMTVALLLCLTCLFLGSSKFVVLDSDFCVLQGIAQLWKKRAFAAVLIKKQKS